MDVEQALCLIDNTVIDLENIEIQLNDALQLVDVNLSRLKSLSQYLHSIKPTDD